MKLKTVRLDPAIVPTRDPEALHRQHGDLKERLMRSAHTDHLTRGERDQMREDLQTLSAKHQALTGVSLK